MHLCIVVLAHFGTAMYLWQRNVKSLVDSKLEKFKNLWEESDFYWGEIEAGTLKFDRVESEVSDSALGYNGDKRKLC